MNDKDIIKLAAKLIETVASKDDIKEVKAAIGVLQNDVEGIQNTIGVLQNDVEGVQSDIGVLQNDIKRIEKKFDGKFKELNEKADTILEFAEHVDETVFKHEKKLKDIVRIPVIAHELRKN